MSETSAPAVGSDLHRRAFILGTLLAGISATASALKPTKELNLLGSQKLERVIPKTIGEWKFVTTSGLVVPTQDESAKLLYSQVVTRTYFDGLNPPIMLLAAYSAGQVGILQIHRPETCYKAGGFSLSGFAPTRISLGDRELVSNRLDASMEGIDEHIIYWTRVGHDLPGTWGAQRFSTAKQNLLGIIPDAILMRASTRGPDRAGSYARLENFVRELMASIPDTNRSIFTG